MRKLKTYKPTRFMADGSSYNRELADLAVNFIGCLKHPIRSRSSATCSVS